MKKSNTFHYRWVHTGNQTPMNPLYNLGRSNSSALSKGGMTIAAYLRNKETKELVQSIGELPEDQFEIVWAVVICSNKENYNRQEARTLTAKIASEDSNVLVSKNHSWERVKEISTKVVNETLIVMTKRHWKRGSIRETLKNSFNIDSYVESGMKSVDTVVNVDPLVAKSSNH